MPVRIAAVEKGSLAEKKHIETGDTLISINGHTVTDVLDYRFYLNDSKLCLEVETAKGKTRSVKIRKSETEDIGLGFETYLMDRQRCCRNKCVFCFIDQLPKGLRESLYFKDDDSRLSFLFGNYITLTNLSEDEIDRIIAMHISPVNISVHTMNPALRVEMMKNPSAGTSLRYIKKLADAGIRINTQLVLCPGINDGPELEYSFRQLSEMWPSVQSIAAVPVGLTCHREGLPALRCFTPGEAAAVIDMVDSFNSEFVRSGGDIIAYAADEFFIKAGREIPGEDYYGGYPQLENGVGLWSLMKSEFSDAIENEPPVSFDNEKHITCVTGEAAFPLISSLAQAANDKFGNLNVKVVRAENRLFGRDVTVAGLLCGADILHALENVQIGSRLLIPAVSLRHEGDLFLDDMSLDELSETLKVEVVPVINDGAELLKGMIG